MSRIIGVLGLAGSGKSTLSKILCDEYGFQHLSFADSLKEAVSVIFGWPVGMLQGKTPESRVWREQVDPWWAKRLGIPNLTPRWALQQVGTDVLRNHFHQDIWVASLERKLSNSKVDIVIDDCRFLNEIEVIRTVEGTLLKIERGPDPVWLPSALATIKRGGTGNLMEDYPTVHISEWGWVDTPVDHIVDNNRDLEWLKTQMNQILAKSI